MILFCLLLLGLNIFTTSCSPNHDAIARQANMAHGLHYTNNFIITTYSRLQNRSSITQPLFVYIEGDGKAWISRTELSSNPTPSDPLVLRLSTQDQHANVIYIARPCQYTPLSLDKKCHSKYWSKARYSVEVIDSISQVIDNFKQSLAANQLNPQAIKIHLIGYSGGGTIATLLADQRTDLLSIRTIAGNLDHDALSDFHHTTKLSDSLNPIDIIPKLNEIPQMHYLGSKDQIIPEKITKNFSDKLNLSNPKNQICSRYKFFPELDHYHGWEKVWKQEVNFIPGCSSAS